MLRVLGRQEIWLLTFTHMFFIHLNFNALLPHRHSHFISQTRSLFGSWSKCVLLIHLLSCISEVCSGWRFDSMRWKIVFVLASYWDEVSANLKLCRLRDTKLVHLFLTRTWNLFLLNTSKRSLIASIQNAPALIMGDDLCAIFFLLPFLLNSWHLELKHSQRSYYLISV